MGGIKMKKIIYLLIFTLLVVGFTACSDKNPEPQPSPAPDNEEIEVTLYYANKEYIETGDVKYERLIPIKKTFAKEEGSNIYLNVLNELKNPPQEDTNAQELSPDNITFKDVKVDNKIAYVDISRENLHGGSLQEGFLLSQVIYTLTEFEEIDKVQFLVDGEVVESLMGHYSADEPLGRE